MNFINNDIYKDILIKIIDELGELDIECVVGFSFGGSLTLQFKKIYFEKYNKELKSILISPAGFQSNTFLENIIKTVSNFLYSFYCNDKWYMIKNYPTYQNTNTLSNTDYIIVSTSDNIHNHNSLPIKTHQNSIILKHAPHLSMIGIIKKQNILSQLIKNDYQIEKVNLKPLTSNLNKLLFGGHFYPYHITFWLSISCYNLYLFILNEYSYVDLFCAFILSSFIYSLIDYFFHMSLHKLFYTHHKKHHIYPNKLSIIHNSMLVVILSMSILSGILSYMLSIINYRFVMFICPLYYLLFEITHLLSHSYKGSNNIIQNAKYYHKLHHIDENMNYSFITPFWDYMFGTLSSKYKVSFIELLFGFIPFYSFFIHKN